MKNQREKLKLIHNHENLLSALGITQDEIIEWTGELFKQIQRSKTTSETLEWLWNNDKISNEMLIFLLLKYGEQKSECSMPTMPFAIPSATLKQIMSTNPDDIKKIFDIFDDILKKDKDKKR